MVKETATRLDTAWFKRRIAECGMSQAQAAARVGMHATSFGRMIGTAAKEESRRDVRARDVVALADTLQTTAIEILKRLGLGRSGGVIPRGRVMADGRVSYVLENPETFSLPSEYPLYSEALVFEAHEGPLAVWDGALVVYLPSNAKSVGPDTVGKLCIIEDSAMAMPVLGVITQATGARGNAIRVFGTGEELKPRRLVRASLVLGIHFRS